MYTLLVVIGSICGFIALFYLVLKLGSRRMNKISNKFLNAIRSNQYLQAYSFMSNEFKKQVPGQGFKEFLNEREIFDVIKYKRYLGDYSINAVDGTVSPIIIRDDGKFLQINLQMCKENGVWKIYAIDAELRLTPASMPVQEIDENLAENYQPLSTNKDAKKSLH